jgi:short-subunit dehydrogenase
VRTNQVFLNSEAKVEYFGISSISALCGGRHAMSYAASKAYISNHLEGLNQRFVHAGLPIVVTDL